MIILERVYWFVNWAIIASIVGIIVLLVLRMIANQLDLNPFSWSVPHDSSHNGSVDWASSARNRRGWSGSEVCATSHYSAGRIVGVDGFATGDEHCQHACRRGVESRGAGICARSRLRFVWLAEFLFTADFYPDYFFLGQDKLLKSRDALAG